MAEQHQVLDVVEIVGETTEDFRRSVPDVIRVIGRVHHLPKTVPVRLEMLKGPSARWLQGQYRASGGDVCIAINPDATEIGLTVAHEFGRYLDDLVLHAVKGAWASHYDEDFEPLIAACMGSSAMKVARRVLAGKGLSRGDRAALREFVLPHEMFARAYAQWVTNQSGDPRLQEQLLRRLSKPFVIGRSSVMLQWESGDFADIMKCVDVLFRRKGLL